MPDHVGRMVKVSAIVPVYNPGPHMDDCVRSLLRQSLAPRDYEVILVDDGSTDGTGERLDALAAEHPHVRVEHIPNSGWPSRPRNVGLELARGEYVYFVDNDDWLGPEALARLHATATRDGADVVVGKVVGHGKFVARELFRANRSGVTLEWEPLLRLLTPHKLFRRALLDEHGIRFPDDGRQLEDHVFVVHAYFHACAISILADYPCYHWVLRDRDTNASFSRFEPGPYYARVREILDLVDEHTEPGPLRDRLYAHWYRGKGLWRLQGSGYLRRSPEQADALYEEVRRLAVERFGPAVDEHLPPFARLRSRLVRGGDRAAVDALARFEAGLEAEGRVLSLGRDGDALHVSLEARLVGEGGPLAFAQRDGGLHWVAPPDLREAAGDVAIGASGDAGIEVMVRSLAERTEYPLPVEASTRLEPVGDGHVTPVVRASARLAPGEAAAGTALEPGVWHLHVVLRVAGVRGDVQRLRGPGRTPPAHVTLRVAPGGRLDRRAWVLLRALRRAQGIQRLARVILRRRRP